MRVLLAIVILLLPARMFAQETVRLVETASPETSYHVSCRVQIAGKMTLPDKSFDIDGKSHIEYDERILGEGKTVRLFSSMAFERKIGTDHQKSDLRPAVYRLVILRQNNIEIPFSPDGPLRLSEIDLIRTDVFTPALAGMLPSDAVAVGASWQASDEATRELTDLEKITAGQLTCRLDKIDRNLAKITFEGTISGIGENGPTRHDLDGFLYFELNAKFLTYVSLRGTEHLLNEKNEARGKVTGTFVLTRELRPAPAAIADLRGPILDPDEANTRILFEDDASGLSFAHHRKWKPRVEGSQVKLDDLRGNGMVLTLDPVSRLPTLGQFLNEARGGVERRKGQVTFVSPNQTLQRQPTTIESLTLDAEVPAGQGTQRATLVLAVVRDTNAGATVAATLVTADRSALSREIERFVRTIRIAKTP